RTRYVHALVLSQGRQLPAERRKSLDEHLDAELKALVVVERLEEGGAHLVQHKAAHEAPEDAKRVQRAFVMHAKLGEHAKHDRAELALRRAPFRAIGVGAAKGRS